jgi:hypothetical protein
MKTLKLILALAAPILAVGAVRSKIRSERVANAPDVVTFVKLAYKPVVKWATNKIVKGRYLDRVQLDKGRFTQAEVNRIVDKTWRYYDELAPAAHVAQLKTQGNRQNKLLGVLTHAMYRAFLDEGLEKSYATELVSDLMWVIYEKWVVFPRSIARLSSRDPQKQMNTMLRMFLRFPFSPPGYESRALSKEDVFSLDIYRCPVHDYFKAQGEEEFMLNSWCRQDFALAQVMTEGGFYERPCTLSAGDKVCDMKWYGRPRPQEVQQS